MARTGADLIVETLHAAGIKRIYGVAGDSLNGITDSLRRDKTIEWVHMRHEEAGAFAAGAEAHLTGELAVCGAAPAAIAASLKRSGTSRKPARIRRVSMGRLSAASAMPAMIRPCPENVGIWPPRTPNQSAAAPIAMAGVIGPTRSDVVNQRVVGPPSSTS